MLTLQKTGQFISRKHAVCARLGRAMLFNQMPNYLIAFVTGRCNMDCTYCCNIARSIKESEEMAPYKWADAVRNTGALIHLTITGGEPFMRQDIDELILAMVQSSGVPDVSINTNGYFTGRICETAENILTALPGIHLTIAISLDGPPEIHDMLRNKRGAASAAFDTITGLSLLKKNFSNLKVRIQSLLVPENAGILMSFFNDSEALPVDFHEIIFPRDIDNGHSISYASLIDAYGKIAGRQQIRNSPEGRMFHALYNSILNSIKGGRQSSSCHAGGRLVEILPDGPVIGCEMAKVTGKSTIGFVGNTERLIDICNSKAADHFRREIARSCSCTFECSMICNLIFNPMTWHYFL
ncbi:MAG: radical SAM protein [Nitrospiraceae bacterium]|nr:MAG: radical SAM protein [Nitrospiraceae bacterium]